MKTKFWSAGIALLALVLCGTAMLAYAQQAEAGGGEGGWGGHHHGMAFMARELNLTDQQKQQIKTMMPIEPREHASGDDPDGTESQSHADPDRRRSI